MHQWCHQPDAPDLEKREQSSNHPPWEEKIRQLQRGYPTTGRYSVGGRRAEPRMTVLLHTCSTSEKDILKTVTVKSSLYPSFQVNIPLPKWSTGCKPTHVWSHYKKRKKGKERKNEKKIRTVITVVRSLHVVNKTWGLILNTKNVLLSPKKQAS